MDVLMAAAEHLAQEDAPACSKAGSGKGPDDGLQELVEQGQDSKEHQDAAENAGSFSKADSAKGTMKAAFVEGIRQKHEPMELKEEQFENILLQLHREAEVSEGADLKSSSVSLPDVETSSGQGGDIFKVGDLVWAKVKSHPWWPGQIFDAADASKSAKKVQKPGRHLVAFFGDGTFGWLQQSQLLEFRPHFEEKVKQTTMKSFCKAVSEALEEVCRRAEVGSSCSCSGGFLHCRSTFPDANTGIQEMGLRIKHHSDISMSKEMLSGERLVKFVKAVACSPFDHWSSSLEASQLRGYALAIRTGLASIGKSNCLSSAVNIGSSGKSRSGSIKREALSEILQQVEDKKSRKANNYTDDVLAKRSSEDKCRSPIFENSRVCIQVQKSALKRKATHGPGDEMLDDDKGCASSRCSHDTGQEVKGNKRSKQDRLAGSGDEPDVKSEKQTEGVANDTETLFALGGFNTKLLKKARKGSLCTVKEKVGLSMSVKKEDDDCKSKELQGSCTAELVSKGTVEHSAQSDNKAWEVQGSCTAEWMSKGLLESSLQSEHAFEVSREVSNAGFLTDKKTADDSGDSWIDGKCTDPFSANRKESLPTADYVEKFLNAGSLSASDSHVMMAKYCAASDHSLQGVGGRDLSAAISHDEVHIDADGKCLELNKVSENMGRIADEEKEGLHKVKLQSVTIKVNALVEGSVGVSVDQNVVKEVVSAFSELKDEKQDLGGSLQSQDSFAKNEASNILLNHLQGLKLLAKDPFHKAAMGKKVDGAITAFMKFRDMIYQKSAGYTGPMRRSFEQDIRKRTGALQDLKLAVSKSQHCLQDSVSRSPKSEVQELLQAARKRKLEVLQEAAARKRKLEVLQEAAEQLKKTEGSQESPIKISKQSSMIPSAPKRPQLLTVDSNIQKSTEQFQNRKNPGLSVNSLKESDNRRHTESPVGLLMKFPQDVALPSEAQLKAIFARFGGLQTTGVRVFKDTASAQVVFKHGKDAEAALHYAKRKRLFGEAAVSCRLKQFQPPSVKVNQQSSLSAEMKVLAKGSATSSAEIKASVRAEESIPLTLLHLPERSSVPNFTFSTERNPVLNPLSSNVITPDFALDVIENPTKSNLACKVASCNLDPKPTVNKDIEDQMMKLLQQLDVLVNLSC